MTDRLADVEARIGAVEKLASVISAIRGIAGARAQEARRHGDGIRLYAATIGDAIGRALALLPETGTAPPSPNKGGRLVILLAAEDGFAGTFNEQVFDAAGALAVEADALFLCGDRGLMVAEERQMPVTGSEPMISHPPQAAALATRLTEMIYAALTEGRISEVSIVHAAPLTGTQIHHVTKRLIPFDYGRFPAIRGDRPPMISLPAQTLLERLVEEYVFAELSEAIVLSLAAEHEARLRAMIAAHDNVAETLGALQASSRRLRQNEITEEILELATGSQSLR
jgi:F-type H+-transporting ATPase subunit gamma